MGSIPNLGNDSYDSDTVPRSLVGEPPDKIKVS